MPRLISREGSVEDVPDANVAAALRAGYRPETGYDATQAAEQAIVADRRAGRGPFDQAGAAALGFASGVTFGATNVLADGTGLASREQQENLRADFPTTSALSEVAGAVAPALLTGGTGALGTAARLTPAGRASLVAARVGAGAEEVGALRGIGRAAAGSAFEGAAQTSGNYLSDAALHDKDLSAEAFMAEAGKGALMGGAVGGGLGAAERGFVAARRLLPKSATQPAAVRAATDEVNAQVAQSLASSDKAIAAAKQKLDMLRLQNADLDIAAKTRLAEKEAERARIAAEKLQQQAQVEATRAAPAPKSSRPRKKGAKPGDAPVVEVGVAAPEEAVAFPPSRPDDFAGNPNVAPENMPSFFGGGDDYVSLWNRGDAPLSAEDVAAELAGNRAASRAPSDIAPSRGGVDQTAVGRKPAKVIPFPTAAERTAIGKAVPAEKPKTLDEMLDWLSKQNPPAEDIARSGHPFDETIDNPDLESLLAATNGRLEAGEGFGALGAERKVPGRGAPAPEPRTLTPRGAAYETPFPQEYLPFDLKKQAKGVDGVRGTVPLDRLKSQQSTVNRKTVDHFIDGGVSKEAGALPKVYKNGDNYFIDDGHNRLTAAWARGDDAAEALIIDVTPPGARVADEAAPRSVLEPIHEAMAEIDPEAARLVEAVKRHEAAADKVRAQFTIRDKNGTRQVAIHELADLSVGRQKQAYLKASGPERKAILEALGEGKSQLLLRDIERKASKTFAIRDSKGTRRVSVDDLGGETLGRIKQAWHAATDAQRDDILRAIGDDKARALIELTEGRASMTTRRIGDPMRAEVTGVGPAPDELDFLRDEVPEMVSVLGDDGRVVQVPVTADDLAEVADLNSTIGEIGEYESSMADLADVLGVDAPPETAAAKQGHDAALDEQAEVSIEQMAREADQIASAPVVDEAPVSVEAAPVPAQAVDDPIAQAVAEAQQRGVSTPSEIQREMKVGYAKANEIAARVRESAPPTVDADLKIKKAENKVATAAARRELKEAQIAKSNLPKPARVPRIERAAPTPPPPSSSIAAAVMKLRGIIGAASKSSMLMPLTGLARVAIGAAKMRDKVVGAVDALLARGAKVAGSQAVRKTAVAVSWRAADALSERLYDDGTRRKTATLDEMVRARVEELQAAAANPAGVRSTIIASLGDVHDPRLVDAAVAVGLRKVEYLAKHMPQPPPPDVFSRRPWRPSPTEAERFARRVRAANHPLTVLEDVANGRVTAEAAETLREVYPRLYQEAQARLVERAADLNAELPHALVVRLAVLFDAPLVRSLQPEHMAAIQAAGAPQQPQAQPPTSTLQPPPAGAPNVSDLYMTADQRRAR